MSQYKDQITGRVIYDLRCSGAYLLDYSKIDYSKTYQINDFFPEFEQTVLKTDNINKLFSSSSLYMQNSFLSCIRNITESNTDFTISTWVYPIATSNREQSILLGGIYNNDYKNACGFRPSYDGISSEAGTKTSIIIFNSNNSNRYTNYATGIELAINTWYHLAMTKQGNIVRFYINGQKVLTQTTALTLLGTDLEIASSKADTMCIGEATVILDQALWTEDSFEVPNNFLTGTKEFDSKYVIWSDSNIPTITGDVVLDARVTRDRKVRNYGSISYSGGYYPSKLNAKIVSDSSPLGDPYSLRSRIKCNNDGSAYAQYPYFKPKTTLTIPVGSTTSKFTTSMWFKLNPVISNTTTWNQSIVFGIHDNENWLNIPIWYIGHNNPGMQIGYNSDNCAYYVYPPTISLPNQNQWIHFAFVKDGVNLYSFVNGTLIASQYKLNTYPNPNSAAYKFVTNNYNMNVSSINIENWNRLHDSITTLYVDDIVLIKDQALWTSNFTPPNDYLTGYKALSDGEIVIDPLYHASVFDY